MHKIGLHLMEFHISRKARDRYQFDRALFSLSGNVIFANFHAARLFAQKINQKRDLVNFPEQAIRAGQITAMGLIDEILHLVVELYRKQVDPNTMQKALAWLYEDLDKEVVNTALQKFCEEFPPLGVYRRQISLDEYMSGVTNGIPNRQIALEEMLVLWLANANLAFSPFMELFDDKTLDKESVYRQIIPSLHKFFDTIPPFGSQNQNLVDMLRSPAVAVPHSLNGQLEFIRQHWGYLLGRYLYRLLSSLDLIREEEKAIFLGPGPARVYDFTGMELEVERFSPDKEWMPRLVLIAKNAYVWLDQLSKKYHRPINTLDTIPDEELETLTRWGFTGLWLIGLWERSAASKRIKQLRGNPEAVASAYSIFDYQIASDLGGEAAFQQLRDRAWRRGIRMASDMVPNHMGIDSRWVIENPDWFIGLDYSPFPSYTFNGPNFSWDQRAGIYIEDHYYNNTDAAVVFKRVDNWTSSSKYIYHGNDGTSMPWNDTAQLNYLKTEVREAVIQSILQVARKFPIIRFDAAMTLAKKHYQRLWFPEPGTGGAIPSRAEFGLTKEQLDSAMPVEFWREVVDRVAQEVPDTLLLAEAFWLMEGYFVRTLGMHRVYNSAFMNMLRDEKNAEYRLVIKNTMEFDPEILKRYVNFMNNPDERTAVDQFGKSDKYFGICTMMATMPGLPMFGHGQIEGFTEKYGMEYRRAYWDEYPDGYLVERHEREIFPVVRHRYLFAEVKDFLLYDFFTPEGNVNEDVFAYSNRADNERSLVIYHNKFSTAKGWIRTSAAYILKAGQGSERILVQKCLGEGLGLENNENSYCIFRDHITGMEYIRQNRELYEKGLYVELDAYKCHVFIDFRQVQDNEWHQYAQLTAYLNGRGVPNIDEAIKEIFLQPIHQPFRELVNVGMFRWVITNRLTKATFERSKVETVLEEAEGKAVNLLSEIKRLTHGDGDPVTIGINIRYQLEATLNISILTHRFPLPRSRKYKAAIQYLTGALDQSSLTNGDTLVWSTLLGWLFTSELGKIISYSDFKEVSRSWVDEWLLGKIMAGTFSDFGFNEVTAWRTVELIKLLIIHQDWYNPQLLKREQALMAVQTWLNDIDIQRYLGVNRYQEILWFNRESFENFLWWMFTLAVINITAQNLQTQPDRESDGNIVAEMIIDCHEVIKLIQKAERESGYQVMKLLEAVRQ